MKPFQLTSDAAPRPKNFNRGHKANRAGKDFQNSIMWAAGIQKHIVAVHQLPPFGAVHTTDGIKPLPICCDFIGAMVGFCGFYFDGKSTADDCSLNVKTFILSKPHQLDFLRLMKAAGQVAGYLVECKAMGKYLWLDVGRITDDGPIRFARDGKLCRQFVDCGSTTLMVDFKKIREAYE